MNKKSVGERIREARKENNLSVRQLAELSGMDHQTIYAYEQGRVEPKLISAAKICEALNVSIDWLAIGLEEF